MISRKFTGQSSNFKQNVPSRPPISFVKQNQSFRSPHGNDKTISSSSHKICQSPKIKKLLPHQQPPSQMEISGLQQSFVSIMHQNKDNCETSRIVRQNVKISETPKKSVRLNFVNRSPSGQPVTSSTHIREFRPNPTKIVTNLIPVNQMEKKIKYLQNRITEIHKEKQESIAKMKQQNRKVYHQNTIFQLKINQLNCLLDKEKNQDNSFTNCDKSNSLEIQEAVQREKQLTSIIEYQAENINILKIELSQVKDELENETQESRRLRDEREKFNSTDNEQLSKLKVLNLAYETQISSLKSQISVLVQNKQTIEKDIEGIELTLNENVQRNLEITKHYEQTMKEMKQRQSEKNHYLESIEIQLDILKTKNDEKIELKIVPEVQSNVELQNVEIDDECKQFEENFLTMISQKQNQVTNLKEKSEELSQQLHIKNSKIVQISEALILYQEKYQQLCQKYEKMEVKLESAESSLMKSQSSFNSSNKSCQKCSELMKTIFRLNKHLNSKESVLEDKSIIYE